MRQAVKDYLPEFFYGHEGRVHHAYIDNVGYVTTGVGNLIDSPAAMKAAGPWAHGINGPLATPEEIEYAWNVVDATRTQPKGVKQEGSIAMKGGNSSAFQALTDLRLNDDDIDALFYRTMLSFEATLKNRFPGYETWPADAQLGLLSMAWALGPHFNYPKFQAYVNQPTPDFLGAAAESGWGNENQGRKIATTALFTNAAAVLASGANPDVLYYPSADIKAIAGGGVGIAAVAAGLGLGAYGLYQLFKS